MRRELQLKRGVIDLETGEFPVTLATNGEAADGHILNVQGMEVPERVPMFVNHLSDPTLRMGSLSDASKDGKANRLGAMRLRMLARIDMDGDSTSADIRRDVAQGISLGDITGMSVRWDPIGEPTPRSGLSKTHWAYSEAGARGYSPPMYFPESRVLEGSIVGVPADGEALIGRANDLEKPEHVREFYRELTLGDPVQAMRHASDLEQQISELRESVELLQAARDEPDSPDPEPVGEPVSDAPSRSEPVDVPSPEEVFELMGSPIFTLQDRDKLEAILRKLDEPMEEIVRERIEHILYTKRGVIF